MESVLPTQSASEGGSVSVTLAPEVRMAALQAAAESGNVTRCRELIASSVGMSAVVRASACQLLRDAAKQGQAQLCKVLVEAGAPVDGNCTEFDLTPLLFAAVKGRRETVRTFIELGADVTHSVGGRGVFLHAVMSGNADLCADLAAMGFDVCARDALGFGALHMAHRIRGEGDPNVRLLDFLVASGVDPNQFSSEEWSPLDYAIRARDFETCRELVRLGAEPGLEPASANRRALTPFQNAVSYGFDKAIEFFVTECRQDPEQRTRDGQTMLQLARSSPETKALLRSLRTSFDVQHFFGEENGGETSDVKSPKMSGML
jgi:ankyrin repeat protein